jgi:NTE family protein
MEISLALGGGGARGIAHLGVLRVLEEHNVKIGAIAGTSMGGLVGACYLAGFSPAALIDRFSAVDQPRLYGTSKGDEPSLLGLAGATQVLAELLGDMTFDDLPVPFAVTAVDIEHGQSIVISDGRLMDAVLATVAVPGIFPARRWGDKLLVDGGVADPVPVDVARELAPGLPVVAVVLSEPTKPVFNMPVPEFPGAAPVIEYLSKIRLAQAMDVFIRSIEVGGMILSELRLELDKPDVIIRPKLLGIGLLDKVDIESLAEIGEIAAFHSLPEISRVTSFGAQIRRTLGLN